MKTSKDFKIPQENARKKTFVPSALPEIGLKLKRLGNTLNCQSSFISKDSPLFNSICPCPFSEIGNYTICFYFEIILTSSSISFSSDVINRRKRLTYFS